MTHPMFYHCHSCGEDFFIDIRSGNKVSFCASCATPGPTLVNELEPEDVESIKANDFVEEFKEALYADSEAP